MANIRVLIKFRDKLTEVINVLIRLDNCHFPIPDITVLKQYLTEIENDCQPADIIADIVQNDNYLQNKDLYLLPLGGLFECDFGIGVISCNNVVYDFWDKLNERLEKEGFKECDIVKYTNLIQRIIYSIKDCLSGLKSDFVHIGIMKNANNKVFLPKKLDNDKAKSILQRGVDANLLDDNFQPIKEKMTKYQMKEFAELASLELRIKEKWKVFGFLWNAKNLGQIKNYEANFDSLKIIENLFPKEIVEKAKKK